MSYGKIFPLGGSGGLTSPSGIAGAIQFSNGSAFASDAANLFWDDTNNRLGVGTNAPSNTTEIQIPSTYGAIGSNANLYLTSALTSAAIKIGASGSGAGCAIQATQSGGGTAFNLALNPFGGSVNVGNSNLGASLGIKGSGSTSATTSLLVQNSASTSMFQVRDDGNISIFTGRIFDGVNTEKSFYISGNDNIVSNYRAVSLRVFDGTAYASGLEVVGNGAESRVGIGTTAPNASAKLQVDSTTKGFLPPRMLQTQRTAIASPAVGLIVYQTDATEGLYIYKSTGWTFIV
jgi:hypothetical protein